MHLVSAGCRAGFRVLGWAQSAQWQQKQQLLRHQQQLESNPTAADLDSPPSIVIMHLAGLLLLRGKHSTAQHPAVRKQSQGSVQSVVPAVSNSQKTAQDAADA